MGGEKHQDFSGEITIGRVCADSAADFYRASCQLDVESMFVYKCVGVAVDSF